MRHNHHWLLAIYGLLLHLYPHPFRDAYGAEMQTVFAAAASEAGSRGRLAVTSFALRELNGLLTGLAHEHGRACLASAVRTPLLTSIIGVFYLGAAAAYITLDITVGFSLIAVASLTFTLAGALPGVAVLARRREPAIILALALYLALILTMPMLDLGPRKAFLRAASSIQAEMSMQEVDRRLGNVGRVPAEPGVSSFTGTVWYIHQFGEGDTDAVRVQFVGGRVFDVQLSPD